MVATHEIIVLVALAFVVLAWIAAMFRLRSRRRKRDQDAGKFAAALGLSMGDDLVISGRMAGVDVTITPDAITVRREATSRHADVLVTRFSIATQIGAEWFLCARRTFRDPLPELEREVTTGNDAFDAKYRLTVNGAPEHRFWEDAMLLDTLLELGPVWVHARPEQLEASFRKENLTRRHDEVWLLRQGLYAALAISAPFLATRFRERLAEPRPLPAPFPASIASFSLSLLLGSLLGAVALGDYFPADWQRVPTGFVIVYFPLLVSVLVIQRAHRRRKEALLEKRRAAQPKDAAPYR